MGHADRREGIRLRSRLTTLVKVTGTTRLHRALTKDISSVGVCFDAEGLLPPNAALELEIKLPDCEVPITCRAEVVWRKILRPAPSPHGEPLTETAVRFLEINPKALSLITQYASMNALPPEEEGSA